jgi:hypothetical protein
VLWFQSVLKEVSYHGVDAMPMIIHEDNRAAIELAKNPEFHHRTKHIDVCWHFCRDQQAAGKIEVVYVPTSDQVADGLTKPLDTFKHRHFTTSLGLRPASWKPG